MVFLNIGTNEPPFRKYIIGVGNKITFMNGTSGLGNLFTPLITSIKQYNPKVKISFVF